jgi:polysaccharide export outer membrane protein
LFEQKNSPGAYIDPQAQPPVYRIQPNDVLQIRNLQSTRYLVNSVGGTSQTNEPGVDQGQTFQVEEDGKVTLPVIGHIAVAGLTRYEAAQKIEQLYRDSLLKNPIIELKILNLKVTLLGEVKNPGNIPLAKENTTLIDVLGEAGGLTNNANEKNIKIIRGDKASPQIIYADLSNIKTLGDPRITLQNNDIIYVMQSRKAVRDEKLQHFTTLIQPSLLIFNTALIIYTLFK